MRRRRLPSRASRRASLVKREYSTDFKYLKQVVQIQYPIRAARTYLQRNMANDVSYRLVEADRGETVGVVRAVEVQHANGGERTWITGQRVLPNGEPASFFVPDHLVRIEAVVQGAAALSERLGSGDRIVVHVPVRGYLKYLPSLFQGEGPVTSRELLTVRDTALQRWGGGLPDKRATSIRIDEDPMRRFMSIFQHLMTTIVDRIDRMVDLTDPLTCDAKFLPWLGSWVGFDLDESLPVHQQRELVRRAIRLFRTRGTRTGIEEMLRVLTAAPARVNERVRPRPVTLGKAVLGGGRDVVERYRKAEPGGVYLTNPSDRSQTSFFRLVLEPRERFRARFGERATQVLRRITNVVSQERPSHVAFTIEFDVR